MYIHKERDRPYRSSPSLRARSQAIAQATDNHPAPLEDITAAEGNAQATCLTPCSTPPMPQNEKTPPRRGPFSQHNAYCGWAASMSLSLRLNCGSRVPITMPAMLNNRPASCGGQNASSVQLYSR